MYLNNNLNTRLDTNVAPAEFEPDLRKRGSAYYICPWIYEEGMLIYRKFRISKMDDAIYSVPKEDVT